MNLEFYDSESDINSDVYLTDSDSDYEDKGCDIKLFESYREYTGKRIIPHSPIKKIIPCSPIVSKNIWN